MWEVTDKEKIEINISTNDKKISGNVQTGAGSDKNFVFTQATASTLWKIKHNLNKFCSVSVVDSAGSIVIGDISYIDKGNIEISFSTAFAGKAYLN